MSKNCHVQIEVGKTESIESAIRRFKRKCSESGVIKEYKKYEHYEKPSLKKKRKREEARRNLMRKTQGKNKKY